MRSLLSQLRPALAVLLGMTALTGLAYPLVVTGLSNAAFPRESRGSVETRAARDVGSSLIGQEFTAPRYFWGRPSATSPRPYDGASSGGSNLGPQNPAIVEAARARAGALRAADPDNLAPIPVDLVSASGSGLDPHVSPAGAAYQVARVARARGLDPARVRALVAAHTESPSFGVIGAPRVNVLLLNLALDDLR